MTSLLIAATLLSPQYSYGQTQTPKTAQVRVVNAIADQKFLSGIFVGRQYWPDVAYGQRTEYAGVEAPKTSAFVEGDRRARLSNEMAIQLQPGYNHTVVFAGNVASAGKFTPIVLRDSTAGRPSASSTQFRFVNALSDGGTVTIRMNGQKLTKYPTLAFGADTTFIGYAPTDYAVSVEDTSGKAIFTTNFRAVAGNRYTGIVMGSSSQTGNRSPRIFFFSF